MSLPDYYDAMRQAALPRLAHGAADLDPMLRAPQPDDDRRGITLIARPPAAVTAVIDAIAADFRRTEPTQYYYPAADIHLTILSIISCYPGFTLARIHAADYQRAVGEVVRNFRPFTVRYAGLTASPGGIIAQGFPQDDSLDQLRDVLRAYFRASPLPQSIDQRYSLQTAHSTIIRFRTALQDPAALLATLRRYEHHFIGSFEVDTLELVYNDWYQRTANTRRLATYRLGG